MLSIILYLILAALCCYKSYKYMFFRPENFPPGPPRVPFVGGYIFFLILNSAHLHKAALWLSKYYKSNIIGYFHGPLLVIVANDYESVKEILNRQEFDGRPDLFLARLRDPKLDRTGLFFTEGLQWRDNRRFILRYLRDLGFGRRSFDLEVCIEEEISMLVDLVQNGPKYEHEKLLFRDDTILCPNIFAASLGNLFLQTLCGERLGREQQGLLIDLWNDAMLFSSNADDYGRLLSLLPFLRYILPNVSGYLPARNGFKGVYGFTKTIIDKQIETYDENHERHVIDRYIKEMSIRKLKREVEENDAVHKKEDYLNYESLVAGCADFFLPAILANSQQLCFLIQRIFLYPEVQIKIQKEIDTVVGQGRYPNLNDRPKLNYTEATVREILRHETLVPSSIPHLAMQDTTYRGYDVPKYTVMVPTLYAFHNQKTFWTDPEVFRPERFLNKDGILDLKLDKSLPFGAGKRLCAGETFARNTLFLFVAALFQKFTISLPKNGNLSKLLKNGTGLITYVPDNFYVKFTPR